MVTCHIFKSFNFNPHKHIKIPLATNALSFNPFRTYILKYIVLHFACVENNKISFLFVCQIKKEFFSYYSFFLLVWISILLFPTQTEWLVVFILNTLTFLLNGGSILLIHVNCCIKAVRFIITVLVSSFNDTHQWLTYIYTSCCLSWPLFLLKSHLWEIRYMICDCCFYVTVMAL